MQPASGVILLSLFILHGKIVKGKGLSLSCTAPDEHVAGQNLTVECQINSMDLTMACDATEQLICQHNSTKMYASCMLKEQQNGSDENRITNITVEIYNVNLPGTYFLNVRTSVCGEAKGNFQLKSVTKTQENRDENKPSPSPPSPPAPLNPALVFGILLLGVTLVLVALGLRRLRSRAQDYRPPTNSPDPDPEVGA